jgi:hypothetical protein
MRIGENHESSAIPRSHGTRHATQPTAQAEQNSAAPDGSSSCTRNAASRRHTGAKDPVDDEGASEVIMNAGHLEDGASNANA